MLIHQILDICITQVIVDHVLYLIVIVIYERVNIMEKMSPNITPMGFKVIFKFCECHFIEGLYRLVAYGIHILFIDDGDGANPALITEAIQTVIQYLSGALMISLNSLRV